MLKSATTAYILWLIGGFGLLGLHRFYLGSWKTGLLYFFTLGFFGIGALLDLFTIPGQVTKYNLERHAFAR